MDQTSKTAHVWIDITRWWLIFVDCLEKNEIRTIFWNLKQMVKKKKTKMSTTLLYILKSNCFTIIFTSVTLSIYIACSYGSISLFWSEGQHMLLDLVTRGIYIIISFNNFKIFIYDHTMSRLTIYFFFRFWIQKF